MTETAAAAFDFTVVKNGIQTVITSFTEHLTVGNIAAILGLVITSCLALYLFYWGARKVIAMLQSAFMGHGFHI